MKWLGPIADVAVAELRVGAVDDVGDPLESAACCF